MFDAAMFNSAEAPLGAQVLDPEGITPVVAIATAHDVAEVREWLLNLDAQAYGRVFIEGEPEPELTPEAALQAPDRVGVTWLRPASRPGVALSAAVDAWLAEWLWVDADARSLEMFTAQHAGVALAPYLQRLECRLEKRWPGCSRESCPKLRAAE